MSSVVRSQSNLPSEIAYPNAGWVYTSSSANAAKTDNFTGDSLAELLSRAINK